MADSSSQGLNMDIQKISEQLRVRPEILKRLIGSFSTTLNAKLQELNQAMSKDDVLKMRAILHEIKGTSGNLRIDQLYAAIEVMHVAVKAGEDKVKITQYFEIVKQKADELTQFVAQSSAP